MAECEQAQFCEGLMGSYWNGSVVPRKQYSITQEYSFIGKRANDFHGELFLLSSYIYWKKMSNMYP